MKNKIFMLAFFAFLLIFLSSAAFAFSYTITATTQQRCVGTEKTLFSIDTSDYRDGIPATNNPGKILRVAYNNTFNLYKPSSGLFADYGITDDGTDYFGVYDWQTYSSGWDLFFSGFYARSLQGSTADVLTLINPYPAPENTFLVKLNYLGGAATYDGGGGAPAGTGAYAPRLMSYTSSAIKINTYDPEAGTALLFFNVSYIPYIDTPLTVAQSDTATISSDTEKAIGTLALAEPEAASGCTLLPTQYTATHDSGYAVWVSGKTIFSCRDNDNDGVCNAYDCADSQTILKLSAPNDAFGKLWNGNYQIRACYDKIFGSIFTGTNPHNIFQGGNNTILKLADTTGTLAYIPQTSGFTSVYYDNLSCIGYDNKFASDCSALGSGYKKIVSLNSNTSAHLRLNSLKYYRPSELVTRAQMVVFLIRANLYSIAQVPDASCPGQFSDVSCDYWAYDEIQYAYDHGFISGYGSEFKPENIMSRAESAVLLARVFIGTLPAPPATPSFSDVPTTYWAYNAIEALKAGGYIDGYPDGTFKPSMPVSRDQMAKFIIFSMELQRSGTLPSYVLPADATFADVPENYWARLYVEILNYYNVDTGYSTGTVCNPNDLPAFTDVNTTDYWAYPYIQLAKSTMHITGYPDGTFMPEREISRGETALFIIKAYSIVNGSCQGNKFTDVSSSNPYCGYIETLKDRGIVSGYDNGDGSVSYKPDLIASRAMTASFIARAQGLPAFNCLAPGYVPSFSDVDSTTDFCNYIEAIHKANITTGIQNADESSSLPLYNPYVSTTRAQMTVFLARALALVPCSIGDVVYPVKICCKKSADVSAGCGDGAINPPAEECDGTNLGGKTCRNLGNGTGTLSCSSCRFDRSLCTNRNCGNGNLLEPREQCDNTNFSSPPLGGNPTLCSSYVAGTSGSVSCYGPNTGVLNCSVNTLACGIAPECGNNIIDAGEDCDNLTLPAGETCDTRGHGKDLFGQGLKCYPKGDANQCKFNFTGCSERNCGNSRLELAEECENNTLYKNNSQKQCSLLNSSWTGTTQCYLPTDANNCSIDVSTCSGYQGQICPNNIAEGTEVCDGADLNEKTCGLLGYSGGTLACNPDCLAFNTAGCTGGANQPPAVYITMPVSCSFALYPVETDVSFTASVSDPNGDSVTCLWGFGDGTTSTDCTSTIHRYSASAGGPKRVTLTATDDNGASATDYVDILIDAAGNDPPLPLISNPGQNEELNIYNVPVWFNASCSIDDQTSLANLNFNWLFDNAIVYNGTGMNGASYNISFTEAGPHWALLDLFDSEGLSNRTYVNFSIKGCAILNSAYQPTGQYAFRNSCYRNKLYFCDDSFNLFSTITESHCQGLDEINGTNDVTGINDDCCPALYWCDDTSGRCKQKPGTDECSGLTNKEDCLENDCFWNNETLTCEASSSILSCSDYHTEPICNEDPIKVGQEGGGFGTEICGTTQGGLLVTDCKCKWNTDDIKCELDATLIEPVITDNNGVCDKFFTLGGCDSVTGFQTLEWSAESTPNTADEDLIAELEAQCQPGQKEIACGFLASKLPFFTTESLLVAMTLLILYYVFKVRYNRMCQAKKI